MQEKTRARQLYFVGKRVDGKELAAGVYTGKATLVRDGQDVLTDEIAKTVTLE